MLLHHLGLEDEVVVADRLVRLDRSLEPDHLTSLYVPALPLRRAVPQPPKGGAPAARRWTPCASSAPGTGCRRTRTWPTPHLVEECYEVLDVLSSVAAAGAGADADAAFVHLEEELGDLLFQIVFHVCLAAEGGHFDLGGVADTVHDKLVHRHPHVFGDADVGRAWWSSPIREAIKKTEKGRASVTEDIPGGAAGAHAHEQAGPARRARVGLEPGGNEGGAEVVGDMARLLRSPSPRPTDPSGGRRWP